MSSQPSGYVAMIDHLLAEKDRLIAEKDELVSSKDKLWREMYAMLRARDAEIDRLRCQLSNRGSSGETHKRELLPAVLKENAAIRERNAELEEVLEKLLADRRDKEESVEHNDGEDEDVDQDVEMEDDMVVEGERTLESSMKYQEGPGVKVEELENDIELAPSAAHLRSGVDEKPNGAPARQPKPAGREDVAISTICSKFVFAPLIRKSSDGAPTLGKIEDVAVGVIQSIREQLETLTLRSRAKKSAACPSGQLKSTGCMWNWMHNHAPETRWTVEGRRDYACVGCFNAGRACLLWAKNMRWIALPLPPAVRRTGIDWKDVDYYINPDANTKYADTKGIWEAPKKSGKHSKGSLVDA